MTESIVVDGTTAPAEVADVNRRGVAAPTSALGVESDVMAWPSECLLVAEAVEKVAEVKFLKQ